MSYKRLFTIIIALLAAFVSATPVSAHSRWGLWVPRQAPARPAPIVDGQCDAEYQNSWNLTWLFYRPRLNYPPARLHLLSTGTDLYVCLTRLQFGLGSTVPFVAVAFDVNHNGGRLPQTDDLRFVLTESGNKSVHRGTGTGGFVLDESVTGWEAVQYTEFGGGDIGLYWNAEFRIPLSLLGGGEPGTVIGFHVRHNWLRFVGDDYIWPTTAGWNVPNSWAHLQWGDAPATSPPIQVDLFRLTQGLEFDTSAGVAYDLVAGKDTLLRFQLYTRGSTQNVNLVGCTLTRLTPSPGPTYSVFANGVPAPQINLYRYGYFNGSPLFNCWIPGRMLAEPGRYRFTLEVDPAGSEPYQSITLGSWEFKPTADLRLFFWGWENRRSNIQGARPWGDDLTAALAQDIWDIQRMFPVRAGAETVRPTGLGTTGLRYMLAASYRFCDDSTPNCSHLRAEANDALKTFNGWFAALERLDGVPRERFDWGSLLEATTATGGGQDCWSGHRVAGSGFDADVDGASASVIFQEVAHCMGQVRHSSPNSNPANKSHSVNPFIPLVRADLPPVNMVNRSNISNPMSVMYHLVGAAPNSFTEGWEWNNLRNTLVTMIRPGSAASGLQIAADDPRFHFVGLIDKSDNVSVLYTKRVDDLPLELSPNFPNSPYKLVLLDATGNVLDNLHFENDFEHTHGQFDSASLVLTMPLPADSTRMEIRKYEQTLYTRDFSGTPPIISNVTATPQGSNTIKLTWNANDPDGDNLNFNVYFLPQEGGIPQLIAAGLTENGYFYPIDLAPATADGRLIVEASDGFNTAQTASNTFTINNKPPVVAIGSPESGANLVAGQLVMLSGAAYDYTIGLLSDDELSWSSNLDGFLGVGAQVETKLSAGTHTLTLSAKAPSGLKTSISIEILVLADLDGDGLADNYESKHSCLNVANFDSNDDPDGDTLASWGEQIYGTVPCEPDSDNDGVSDGDEVRGGSNPLENGNQPALDKLYVSSDTVDMGSCPSIVPQTIKIQTLSADVAWSVAADQSWLSVSGGGVGDGQVATNANCSMTVPGKQAGRVLVSTGDGQLRFVEVNIVGQALDKPAIFLPIILRNQ